jgi:nitrate reductase (NAD(P)H)
MMSEYHIGTLDDESRAALGNGDSNTADSKESDPARPVFLQSKQWSKATLEKKTSISHDTKIFTFKLDHSDQLVGLPIGQHLLMRLRDPATREAIIRAYTPISQTTNRGEVDVLVKIYKDIPGRQGGKMTQALDAVPTGHFVDFKGPVGRFEYCGRGSCTVNGKTRQVRRFIMVCAGSGITPIYQVLRAILSDPEDPTHCLVLNGNRSEEDILCRSDLDLMSGTHALRCRIIHTLSSPHEKWEGRRGRVSKGLFEEEVGSLACEGSQDAGSTMVLICGPTVMEESVKSILLSTGWADEDMLVF